MSKKINSSTYPITNIKQLSAYDAITRQIVKATVPFITSNKHNKATLLSLDILAISHDAELQVIKDSILAELNRRFNNDIPSYILQKLDITVKIMDLARQYNDLGVSKNNKRRGKIAAINSQYSLNKIIASRISQDPSLSCSYLTIIEEDIQEAIL